RVRLARRDAKPFVILRVRMGRLRHRSGPPLFGGMTARAIYRSEPVCVNVCELAERKWPARVHRARSRAGFLLRHANCCARVARPGPSPDLHGGYAMPEWLL